MIKEYDAIVAGGGLAGLTCASYLCRYGYKTLLCEKAAQTGGLVRTFRHRGFAFDAGIRAFENSGILFPMLKSLGIELEWNSSPVCIGAVNEWVRLASRESLDDYEAMLGRLFPENRGDIRRIGAEIEKVMRYMDVLYGIDNPLFREDMFKDSEYMLKTLLPWLIRYQGNIRKASRLSEPVRDYLRRFTRNEALIDIIASTFLNTHPRFSR